MLIFNYFSAVSVAEGEDADDDRFVIGKCRCEIDMTTKRLFRLVREDQCWRRLMLWLPLLAALAEVIFVFSYFVVVVV